MQTAGLQTHRPTDTVWCLTGLQANFMLIANFLKWGCFIVQTQISVTLNMGPSGPTGLPLFMGMRPSHQFSISSHEPPLNSRPEYPAACSASCAHHECSKWNLISPQTRLPTAFLCPRWWQFGLGGRNLGLILDCPLSLKLDSQLVSIPVHLFCSNTCRVCLVSLPQPST